MGAPGPPPPSPGSEASDERGLGDRSDGVVGVWHHSDDALKLEPRERGDLRGQGSDP